MIMQLPQTNPFEWDERLALGHAILNSMGIMKFMTEVTSLINEPDGKEAMNLEGVDDLRKIIMETHMKNSSFKLKDKP